MEVFIALQLILTTVISNNIMFGNIEEEIKKFRTGRDYYLYDDGQKKVYTLLSKELKEAVCPFPKIWGINGGRKSEKSELGNYFSYEEGRDNSPDKFVVVKSNEVNYQKNEEIKRLDEEARELDKQAALWDKEAAKWDRENALVAQNNHPRTVSVSIYNDKGEKVFEKTKTSTYYPQCSLEEATIFPQIKEISEEEAKKIENERREKKNSELGRKKLEAYQHQLPKK